MSNQADSQKKGKAIKRYLMVFLILTNAILFSASFFFSNKNIKTKAELQQRDDFIEEIEDALKTTEVNLEKYRDLSEELNKALSIANDQIDKLKEEIEVLRAGKSNDSELQYRYQLLQEKLASYVHRIDSLVTANQKLSRENLKLRNKLEEEQDLTNLLRTEQEVLKAKLGMQTKPSVSNVMTIGIQMSKSGSEQQTFDLKNIEKMKICFDVGTNPNPEPERKWMYLVITSPSGEVLNSLESGTFKSNDGEMDYTAHMSVLHDKNRKNICMYTLAYPQFDAGAYTTEVYFLGEQIHSSNFELK